MVSRRTSFFHPVLILALLVLLVCAAGPASALPAHMVWSDVWNYSAGIDLYADAAPTIDGGFVAAGIVNDTGLGFADTANLGIAKFAAADDASPHRVWTRTWDNPIQHLADKANAVCTDLTGGIVAAGYSVRTPVGRDWAIVKWNASGVFQWSHELVADQVGGVAIAYDVTVDGAGDFYVCGTTQTGPGAYALVVRKLSGANGQQIWRGDYAGLAGTYTAGMKIVLDDHLNSYVVGTGSPTAVDADIILVKFNAAGQRLWTKSIDGGHHLADQGVDVRIQGDYVYVLGGMSIGVGKRKATLARYTTGGTRRWLRTWQESSATAAYPQALVVDNGGNAVAAGYSTLSGNKSHAFLVKWTKGGGKSWAKVSFPQTSNVRQFLSLTGSTGGELWVGGSSRSSRGDTDWYVAHYSASGALKWKSQWNGEGNVDDSCRAVGRTVSGKLFGAGVISGGDAAAARYAP